MVFLYSIVTTQGTFFFREKYTWLKIVHMVLAIFVNLVNTCHKCCAFSDLGRGETERANICVGERKG